MSFIYRFATLLVLFSAAAAAATVERNNGVTSKGTITVDLIWYGKFTPTQRSIIVDFIRSISSSVAGKSPTVASWWKTTGKYKTGGSTIVFGKQLLLEKYPLGKSLKSPYLRALSNKLNGVGAKSITVVLTAKDVTVEGFCMNRCGTHGLKTRGVNGGDYVWVGNSETQCPGYCAWPFHQPIYGPQSPPLVAPNGDVGVDGMIINLATLLVNTVTKPSPETVSACTGIFGSGAYPGYAGRALVDKNTGASYNALGLAGRKYLLPAMWDPEASKCKTLV